MTDLAFDTRRTPNDEIIRSRATSPAPGAQRLQVVHSQSQEPDRPGLNRGATAEPRVLGRMVRP